MSTPTKQRKRSQSTQEPRPTGNRSVADERAMIKERETEEMEAVRRVRNVNVERQRKVEERLGEDPHAIYCVCRRGVSGFMVQCELCCDWFHGRCVGLPPKSAAAAAGGGVGAKDLKFLCPVCCRTKRPRIEIVRSIVEGGKKVQAHMLEVLALERLVERTMDWQIRARHALRTVMLKERNEKTSSVSPPPPPSSSMSPHVDVEALSPEQVTAATEGTAAVTKLKIELSDDERATLEELAIEGDMLEVTVDETQQIWSLLQSGKGDGDDVVDVPSTLTEVIPAPLFTNNSYLFLFFIVVRTLSCDGTTATKA